MKNRDFHNSLETLMFLKDGVTRSYSYENMRAEKGKAAKSSSILGPSRKGSPFLLDLPPGETAVLVEIEGAGIIRHLFLTVIDQTEKGKRVIQELILRIYWEGEQIPAVECPLGEFFCCGDAKINLFGSVPVTNVPARGFHCYFPMPFQKKAKVTLENRHAAAIPVVAYQIDCSMHEQLSDNIKHFHARSFCEKLDGEDSEYTILEETKNCGYYVGSYLVCSGQNTPEHGIEKENIKIRICLDDQEELAAVDCAETGVIIGNGFYRWHIADPVQFQENIRVSIEHSNLSFEDPSENTRTVTGTVYWYQSDRRE